MHVIMHAPMAGHMFWGKLGLIVARLVDWEPQLLFGASRNPPSHGTNLTILH